jgi:hypothetical protein
MHSDATDPPVGPPLAFKLLDVNLTDMSSIGIFPKE